MAAKANVSINIASEFTGKKAFGEANNAVGGLDKAVGALGKKLAGAFSVYKLAEFSKKSVEAFMADQKAAAQLANTLKNVGYSNADKQAESFIQTMQKQTGILDDDLRPAYAQLLQTTGSLTQTQKILGSAFDISSGTGNDFKSVVDALSQAYVGNTKGLRGLNAGLTKTELSTKTFSELMDILNSKFSGAGATAVDTYAGKVKIFQATVADAQETVGKGFVDAFTLIAEDQDFTNVTDAISNMAQNVADALLGVGTILDTVRSKFNSMPSWVKTIFSSKAAQDLIFPIKNGFTALTAIGKQKATSMAMPSGIQNFLDEQAANTSRKEQAKAEADAARRAKQLADAIKKQNAAQAELVKKKKEAVALDALSLKYKQAASIFDLEKVELAAAAMSKQTAEDYARIKLKSDLIVLNEAIQAGDLKAAEAAAKVVEEDYKRVQAYQAMNLAAAIQAGKIANIGAAVALIPTDLKIIDMDNLNAALKAIKDLIDELNKLPKVGGTNITGSSKAPDLPPVFNPDGSMSPRGKNNIPSVESSAYELLAEAVDTLNKNTAALKPMLDSGFFDLAFNAAELSGANINPYALTDAQAKSYSQNQTITIVDNTSGLIQVVTDATQQATANGINTRLVRNTGNLSW